MPEASSPQLIWVTEPDDSIALVLFVPFGAHILLAPLLLVIFSYSLYVNSKESNCSILLVCYSADICVCAMQQCSLWFLHRVI